MTEGAICILDSVWGRSPISKGQGESQVRSKVTERVGGSATGGRRDRDSVASRSGTSGYMAGGRPGPEAVMYGDNTVERGRIVQEGGAMVAGNGNLTGGSESRLANILGTCMYRLGNVFGIWGKKGAFEG